VDVHLVTVLSITTSSAYIQSTCVLPQVNVLYISFYKNKFISLSITINFNFNCRQQERSKPIRILKLTAYYFWLIEIWQNTNKTGYIQRYRKLRGLIKQKPDVASTPTSFAPPGIPPAISYIFR